MKKEEIFESVRAAVTYRDMAQLLADMNGRDFKSHITAQALANWLTDRVEKKISVKAVDIFSDDIALTRHAAPATAEPFEPTAGTLAERALKAVTAMMDDDTKAAIENWAVLEPYLEENDSIDAIVATAAARARAAGNELPALAAERIYAAQNAHAAQRSTQIVTTGGYIPTIVEEAILDALELPGEHDSFDFDENGMLIDYSLQGKELKHCADNDKLTLRKLIQFAYMSYSDDIRESDAISVHLPTVYREWAIDVRPRKRVNGELVKRDKSQSLKRIRAQHFKNMLAPYANRVIDIPNEGMFTVASFQSWDEESDIATFTAPFAVRYARMVKLKQGKWTAIKHVFHANIAFENAAAIELADLIVIGLIKRGVTTPDCRTYNKSKPRSVKKQTETVTKPDGTTKKTVTEYAPAPDANAVTKSITTPDGITRTKTEHVEPADARRFTWHVKTSALVKGSPTLTRQLNEIEARIGCREQAAIAAKLSPAEIDAIHKDEHKNDRKLINQKLQAAFESAIRLINEKSDAKDYYIGLTFTNADGSVFKAPTKSTLNRELYVTHYGKNKQYKAPV